MRFWVVVALCGCSAAPRAVEIAAPLASTPHSPPKVAEDELPPKAVAITSDADGAWAAPFPKAKGFVSLDLPESSRVLLTWKTRAARRVRDLEPGADYPANYDIPVELEVSARGAVKRVALGGLTGSIAPYEQSFCVRTNAPDPSVAAWFGVGVVQGSSDFMIVRDIGTLHVIHRESSDGKCDDVKQGPLDVCDGSEWEIVADVHVGRNAALYERVTVEGAPLDCGEVAKH
jgi:hypothetical protein